MHSPFPRPGNNGGSPGEQGCADSRQGPQRQRGTGPSLPKSYPAQTSHTQSSLSLTQCSTKTPSFNPSCPDPAAASRLLSPPCRLSEVRQSRKRAVRKAQVPMMPGRVGGHIAFPPLNISAGWGPSPRPPHWQRLCYQIPGGQLPPPSRAGIQSLAFSLPHPSSIMGADSWDRPPPGPQASSTPVRDWGPGARSGGSAGERQAGTRGHPWPSPNTAGERGEPGPEMWV